jgi:hypothetical protein
VQRGDGEHPGKPLASSEEADRSTDDLGGDERPENTPPAFGGR